MNKLKILFLCTHNSCRSQMAEGLVNHFFGELAHAFSAGTEPARLDLLAVQVMGELGIDISQQQSKALDEFNGQEFDFVISLCGDTRENCPLFFGGTEHLHIGLEDPSRLAGSDDERLHAYRKLRDAIKTIMSDFFGHVSV